MAAPQPGPGQRQERDSIEAKRSEHAKDRLSSDLAAAHPPGSQPPALLMVTTKRAGSRRPHRSMHKGSGHRPWRWQVPSGLRQAAPRAVGLAVDIDGVGELAAIDAVRCRPGPARSSRSGRNPDFARRPARRRIRARAPASARHRRGACPRRPWRRRSVASMPPIAAPNGADRAVASAPPMALPISAPAPGADQGPPIPSARNPTEHAATAAPNNTTVRIRETIASSPPECNCHPLLASCWNRPDPARRLAAELKTAIGANFRRCAPPTPAQALPTLANRRPAASLAATRKSGNTGQIALRYAGERIEGGECRSCSTARNESYHPCRLAAAAAGLLDMPPRKNRASRWTRPAAPRACRSPSRTSWQNR